MTTINTWHYVALAFLDTLAMKTEVKTITKQTEDYRNMNYMCVFLSLLNHTESITTAFRVHCSCHAID